MSLVIWIICSSEDVNASPHFHSNIQMRKQIYVWLKAKSLDNQNSLLQRTREQWALLRKRHIEQEKVVMQKVKAKLEANHRQQMEKKATQIELKRVIASVQAYDGPCKNVSDVDQLLDKLRGESEAKKTF